MNIAFVLYGDLNQQSGGYLYDRRLVGYLRGEGDQIDVVSLPQRSYGASLLDNFSSDNGQASQADIILQDELCHPSLVWSNRRIHSARIIALVHHLRSSEQWPAWEKQAYRYLEVQYLKTVQGVICTSQRTCHLIQKLMRKNMPNLVAHPGKNHIQPRFSEEDLRSRSKNLSPLRLVFVGNLIPRKGLHTLLKALSNLKREQWHLTVIGSAEMQPSYAAAMNALAVQYGLSERVAFMGALGHAQIAEHLQASHVLVIPSHHEGFGIAYLEGMGFGLPAIASSSGGASDIVEDRSNGFLVSPDNDGALNRRLRTLIEKPQVVAEMGMQALKTYARHPTWERSGQRIRKFLIENLNA